MLYFMSFKIIDWRNIKWKDFGLWQLRHIFFSSFLFEASWYFTGMQVRFWMFLIDPCWFLVAQDCFQLDFKTKQNKHNTKHTCLAVLCWRRSSLSTLQTQFRLHLAQMACGEEEHYTDLVHPKAGSVLKWFSKQVVCIYWSSKGIF